PSSCRPWRGAGRPSCTHRPSPTWWPTPSRKVAGRSCPVIRPPEDVPVLLPVHHDRATRGSSLWRTSGRLGRVVRAGTTSATVARTTDDPGHVAPGVLTRRGPGDPGDGTGPKNTWR